MEKSDQVNELFTALSKAQGEFSSVSFDKVNPHFKSKYASLSATQEMARAPLAKNGLALIQSLQTEGKEYYIETLLTHSSGQWISDRILLMLDKTSMQGLGSATTYAKRYAAQSILGICGDEDDDGNAAGNGKKEGKEPFDPESFVMPFGRSQGKRLGDIDTATLCSARDWTKKQIELTPPPDDVVALKHLYGLILMVLKGRPPEPPPEPQKPPPADPQAFPPDDVLPMPRDLDEHLNDSVHPVTKADPGAFVIPLIKIGNWPTHNKRIDQFTEPQLKNIIKVCDLEIKSETSKLNKGALFDVRMHAIEFLTDMGVAP